MHSNLDINTSQRLQRAFDKLLSKDHTASIKGRFVGKTARLLLDIFEFYESNNEDGIFFQNFSKDFYSTDWKKLILVPSF